MTLILISTSWRYSLPDQPSGRLLVLDLEKQRIVRTCEIVEPPFRDVDPNPRGGFRGLKGISIHNSNLAIANASTVFIYDHLWNPIAHFFHPSCAGIHDIHLEKDCVWITSSRNDLLLCLDFSGRIIGHYDLRKSLDVNKYSKIAIKPFLNDEEIIQGKINFRDPQTHDHAFTDLMHVNSIAKLDSNHYLVSCGLLRNINNYFLHKLNNQLKKTSLSDTISDFYKIYQKIFNKNEDQRFKTPGFSKETSKSIIMQISIDGNILPCLILDNCKVPSHSVRMLQDGTAIYLNSTNGKIVHFDPYNCEIYSKKKVGTYFLRGAIQIGDGSILVGDNNYLIHYNLSNEKILAKIKICDDPNESIFDINLLPKIFDLPPESFIRLQQEIIPIQQK